MVEWPRSLLGLQVWIWQAQATAALQSDALENPSFVRLMNKCDIRRVRAEPEHGGFGLAINAGRLVIACELDERFHLLPPNRERRAQAIMRATARQIIHRAAGEVLGPIMMAPLE